MIPDEVNFGPHPPCNCACHRFRGVVHVAACCDQPPLGGDVGTFAYHLTWNPNQDPFFDHYELSRSENGMGWTPIALVSDRDDVSYYDYEFIRSAQVAYRVRVVATNGASTPWIILQPEKI